MRKKINSKKLIERLDKTFKNQEKMLDNLFEIVVENCPNNDTKKAILRQITAINCHNIHMGSVAFNVLMEAMYGKSTMA